jgi:tetratricopeptide (TPR) repeat protein
MSVAQARKAFTKGLNSRDNEVRVCDADPCFWMSQWSHIWGVRAQLTRLVVANRSGHDRIIPFNSFKKVTFIGSGYVAIVLDGKEMFRGDFTKNVADALYVLQQNAMKTDELETAFADTARAYREANTRPVVSEAVRRLKVQAEDAVREKNFEDAASLYEEATQLAPWWSAGHFNYALISSETGDYDLAVREMKRYLLLVPNAPDARDAQNNIYKWERKASAPN